MAVLGCGGAGKTTLARRLGSLLGIEVVHIDFLRYGPGGHPIPEAKFRALHREVVNRERWIIDAMKLGLLADRLEAADTAIFLDRSRLACLTGVLRRRLRYRGRICPALGVVDWVTWEFLVWIFRFPRDVRPRVLEQIDHHADTTRVVVLRNRREIRRFIRDIERRGSLTLSAAMRPSTTRS
ncbi:MAG: topology modulation protein [Actinobacteria bacterium]|nr:topology modulation protein [Actinomycetota bacterium]